MVHEVGTPFHEPGARYLRVWGVPREMEPATAVPSGGRIRFTARAWSLWKKRLVKVLVLKKRKGLFFLPNFV